MVTTEKQTQSYLLLNFSKNIIFLVLPQGEKNSILESHL